MKTDKEKLQLCRTKDYAHHAWTGRLTGMMGKGVLLYVDFGLEQFPIVPLEVYALAVSYSGGILGWFHRVLQPSISINPEEKQHFFGLFSLNLVRSGSRVALVAELYSYCFIFRLNGF